MRVLSVAHQSFQLVLNSWPVMLAGLTGILSTHATEVLTHKNAPQWVKSGVNLVLTTLGGVLVTVETVPGYNWKDYLGVIGSAEAVSLITHWTGATAWLQEATKSVGIGANTKPLVPDASAAGTAGGTEGPAGGGVY